MRDLKSFAMVLSSALLLAACSSTKLNDSVPIVEGTSKTPATQAAGGDATRAVPTVDVTQPAVDPLNDQKGILAKRSVYFDFDSYAVKDEFKPLVAAHAKYLSAHNGLKIVIQGNTDERGGREYNLALGQKRAEAVRKSMAVLGAPDAQMEAVSFGKEKPKAQGSNEAAWAENRRSDIVY